MSAARRGQKVARGGASEASAPLDNADQTLSTESATEQLSSIAPSELNQISNGPGVTRFALTPGYLQAAPNGAQDHRRLHGPGVAHGPASHGPGVAHGPARTEPASHTGLALHGAGIAQGQASVNRSNAGHSAQAIVFCAQMLSGYFCWNSAGSSPSTA